MSAVLSLLTSIPIVAVGAQETILQAAVVKLLVSDLSSQIEQKNQKQTKTLGDKLLTYSTEDNKGGCEAETFRKGSEKHGACEHQVTRLPHGEEVRFHLAETLHQVRDARRRAVGELLVLGDAHDQGQEPGAGEGHERVNSECVTSDPAHIAQCIGRCDRAALSGGRSGRIIPEVCLADPGAPVEVKREPPYPGPEHGPANYLDARREVDEGRPDLADYLEAPLG